MLRFDSTSRFVVLKEQGRLEDCVPLSPCVDVVDVLLPWKRALGIRRMLWEAYHVPDLVRRHRIDVFLTFSHYLPPRVRCPIRIVGVSNLAPFSKDAWRVSSWPERLRLSLLRRSILWSARRATDVLGLSRACREYLSGYGVRSESIHVVSNGSDTIAGPTGSVVEHPPDVTGDFVLYVSHFYAYKNFECVMNAFARLPGEIREKYRLVLVGHPYDRAYFRRIEQLASRLQGTARISIIPGLPRSHLSALYAGCAAFLFPSRIENSPNILLEAMAAGAACIVSSAQPMPEFAGEAVLYFDPNSPDACAAEILRLLRQPQLRVELGVLARARAAEFTWDALVEKTVGLYLRRAPSVC
jgi:glycosyltransferase involved in cell wall biosynthesis